MAADPQRALTPEALREAYEKTFVARDYVEASRSFLLISYQEEELHSIFNSDLVPGGKLLEIGSGPTVRFALAASKKFQDIVLSDLVPGNRKELEQWRESREDALDWSSFAERFAALEGYGNIEEGASEVLNRTRLAIRKVIPCDVLDSNVLPEEHRETFDAVLSCNCINEATGNLESFGRALVSVGALVRPGGVLLLAGIGGSNSPYPVGNKVFPLIPLSEEEIRSATTGAGFRVKSFRTRMYNGPLVTERGSRFGYVMVAEKE